MSGRDLLRRLDDLGIGLTLAGDRIRYRGADARLTPELLAEMKERRDELIGLLGQRAALHWPPPRDTPAGTERSGPLTRAQRTFWATDHFVGDGIYNLAGSLRLRGPLDEDRLDAAVSEVYRRHPALRTVFPAEHGEPIQQVLPPGAGPAVERLDRAGWSLDAAVAECAEFADRKLPLVGTPPVRMRLIRLADREHVFFVVVHHIVADAVSVGLLLTDLAAGYRGARLGDPELDLIDVARWERDRLAYADLSAGQRYWRERLGGAELGVLPLPPPVGPVTERRGAAYRLDLDPAVAAKVRELAIRRRTGVFPVVAAAVAVSLSRRAGRNDLVLGMPAGRRDRPGLDRVAGPLLDMVPVRLELAGTLPFADVVGRTRRAVLGALAHAEALADLLAAGGDAAGRGLFTVVLTDAGGTLPVPVFPRLTVEHVEVPHAGAKYDLNVLVAEGDTIVLEAEFDRAAIAEAEVRALLTEAAETLAGGAEDPARAVAELAASAFGDPGRGAVGAEPAWVAAPDDSLSGRLARLGAEQPGRVALSDGDDRLTYRELAGRVDLVGRALRARGSVPGEVVGVSLPRGLDLVTAILGVMAAGAACAVLDDSWPPTRRERVLADAAVRQVIGVDDGATVADLIRLGRSAPPCPPVRSGDTAYVIYTSGSTGRPKGVHVTHRNMLSLLAATGRGFGLGPEDVWTLFHSCSFDVAMYEMFGCLLHGGRLVVVPKWMTRDPRALASLLGRERVSVLSLTPSAMSVLLPEAARDPAALDTVRHILLAGEKLENRLADRWHREVGRGELVNLYGITETTVHASWLRLRPDAPTTTESDVGVPLPGTSLYLLDDNGTAVADGCVGEIYVGGPQVSLGYLGQPRETAARFLPDPFSRQPGARMYRSGDLGRRTGDRLAYLQRRDAQVQVNGFRVELPEVEAVLAGLPGVAAAAAAVATDDIGHRVVAVVVAEPGAALSTADVLRGAGAELPNYMLPRSIAIVPALPLTVNGKLDRAAVLQAAGAAVSAPPRPATTSAGTPAAAVLVELFRQVLDDPSLAAGANFFDAGGDSMRAIRLVALARERGLHFTAREVYASPYATDLAAVAGPSDGFAGQVLPFALLPGAGPESFPAGVVDAYPMTAMQIGMLYHQETAPEARAYHIVLSYRVGGRFDPAAFRAAVQAVADAHPVLRTSLDLAGPWGPVQRVHDALEALPLRVEDLRGLGEKAQEQDIARVVAQETSSDFPLARPGLFRLVVLVISDDDYQLVFSHNHVILDGWSVNAFFADLSACYAADAPGAVPVPRTTFADYVSLELAAAEDPAHLRYWRTQVSVDGQLVAPGRTGSPVVRQLRREMPGRLAQLRSVGVPVKALLLTVHLRVLSWLTGSDDVVTSAVTNCRPEGPDAERTLGLFLNQLPLLASLGGSSWLELARSLHEREREMLAHRWYPGALIQRDFGPRPMFDSGFNFTDYHGTRQLVRDGDVRFSASEELERTHYALSSAYTVDVRTGELRLLLEYDSAALPEPMAELILQAHDMALTALLADPDASCAAVPLPSVPDRARVAAAPVAPPAPAEPTATDPALESLIRAAWAQALGTDEFGAHDNFFQVGGDSLAAMRMVARVRADHPDLAMGAFLAEPTVAALVALLAAGSPATAAEPRPATVAAGPRRFPLSPAQLQMWSIVSRLPGLPLFAVPGALQADGPFDPALLERTFQLLATRHDALRTRIEATDGGAVQVVEPAVSVALDYVDLTGTAETVAEAERRMTAAVREPIAVDRAPMLRAAAYRVAADRHLLYVNIHHMICDGWSLSLLLADAARIYRCLEVGTEIPPLPSGPLAAEWVADVGRGSAETERQRAYWTERLVPPWPALADGPQSRLLAAPPLSPIDQFRSRTCRRTLDGAATEALRASARKRGITDFMAVATAYAMTLHAWSGQSDLRIGTILANRARPGVEEVVGLIANTAVLRVSAADAGPDELADRVRSACEGAYANQELAFEDVLEALRDAYPAEPRDTRLFEVMLVMQEEIRATEPAGGLRFAPYRATTDVLAAPVAVTTCELLLNVVPWDGELLLSLQYRPAVTDRATAVALLDDVAGGLTALGDG